MAKKYKEYQHKKTINHHVRKFLNKKEGMAAIETGFSVKKDKQWGDDASVHISDCSQTITLDFYYSTPEAQQIAVKKLDLIVDVLNNLKADILSDELVEVVEEPVKKMYTRKKTK
jgi:hypothetical protein